MEQVGAGPVEDGHEVVGDHLYPEGGQIAQSLLVVFDILIPGGQADFDVVVDVDALHHIHVEAVLVQLCLDLRDLLRLPDLAGHLVVEGPDDTRHAGDLLDVGQLDLVVALAVPAECHLHHVNSSYFKNSSGTAGSYPHSLGIARLMSGIKEISSSAIIMQA